MNLGHDWIPPLQAAGYSAVHWSRVGDQDEADDKIMEWARESDHAVLTADLDFGMRLVRSGARGPSVIQLRTADTLPARVGTLVISAIDQARDAIDAGAIVTIEAERIRIRRLNEPDLS